MRIVEPAASLARFIKAYIIIESDEGLVSRLLPDTVLVLAFRYKGTVNFLNKKDKIVLPAFSISGIRSSSKSIQYSKNSGNILVQFREGCAAVFFSLPVHELFELNVSLDILFGKSLIQHLEEQIFIADTVESKIEIIERFLIGRLQMNRIDLLIENSIQKIYLTNGILKIKQLAQSLYISHDAFEKRFRKAVGTTPKQFAAIVRIKSLINQSSLKKPTVELALDAGFFDQSHFIKEFKKYAGQTPKDFFNIKLSR